MSLTSAPKHFAPKSTVARSTRIRIPWLVAFCLIACLIWGNSLVPGESSGSFSLMILGYVHGALSTLGLPYEWLSHLLLRKMAHFTEYLVLGLVGMQAFGAHRKPFSVGAMAVTILLLAGIPCIDETIQLFVDGRAGQPTDVLIDCGGALTGVLLTFAASTLSRRGRPVTNPVTQL